MNYLFRGFDNFMRAIFRGWAAEQHPPEDGYVKLIQKILILRILIQRILIQRVSMILMGEEVDIQHGGNGYRNSRCEDEQKK